MVGGKESWSVMAGEDRDCEISRGGLERIFRDARLGRMHPANAMLTREIVAKTTFGIGLDENPRWG